MSTFPTANLPLYGEMFIGARWVDVIGDVRQRNGIRVNRGGGREGTVSSYTRCDFQLDNRDPHPYSPLNPNSTYYGQLGRNVPFRCGVTAMTDSFTRSVTDGWGSASTGQAWTTGGAGGSVLASDFQVTGTAGTQSVPAVSGYRYCTTSGLALRDVYVQVDVTLSFTNVTGGSVEPATILLRRVSATEYYMARVFITTTETVQVELSHSTAGILAAATTVAGLTHTSTQTLRVGALIEGSTLRVKVWPATSDEPYGWHLEATDTADTTPAGADVAIRSGISAGNTNTLPIVFSYDQLIVRVPLAATEIPSFPVRSDQSGRDVWVDVKSAGIMKRLGQGTPPAQSAPRRYIPTSDPAVVAYWPLEDGPLAVEGAALIGEHPMRLYSTRIPSQHFGQGELASWLPNGATLYGTDTLYARVDMPTTVTKWAVDHIQRNELPSTVQLLTWMSDGRVWIVKFIRDSATSSTGSIEVTDPGGAAHTGFPISGLWDTRPHHVRWVCEQGGGQVNFFVDIDGESVVNSAAGGGLVLYPLVQVDLGDLTAHTEKVAFAHVVVYGQTRPLADFEVPILGYQGEAAGTRIARICAEEGIAFTCEGDPADSALCGPQRTEPVLKILQDAAAAAQGELYESRGVLGLAFRPISGTYNQDPVQAVSHAAHELSGQLEPADELFVANDVTATQRDGTSYQSVLETGPMSVQPPEDGGAGRYRQDITLNVHEARQVKHTAGWLRHLGTAGLPRYKAVQYALHSRELGDSDPELHRGLGLDLHDRLDVTSPPARLQPDTISTLVRSLEVRADQRTLEVTASGEPYDPFEVFKVQDSTRGRVHTGGSVVAAAVNTSATALSVATTETPPRPWITNGARLPLTITVAGETMAATAIADEVTSGVVAGTVAHGVNASVTPGLPAGLAAGDLLVCLAAIRNSGAGVPQAPAGYTRLPVFEAASNTQLFAKIAGAGEAAPTVTFTGGVANADTSAQLIKVVGKFYNVDHLVVRAAGALNASGQDIPYPGLTVRLPNCLILYAAWKQDDWTSVASPGTEIGEPDTTTGDDQGIVWAYQIQTTAAHIPAGSFTVTGGVGAISRGAVVAIRCDRQSFTVTRSTNGISKAHAAGDTVRLASRHVIAL
jgi:hypothetical protein